MLPDTLPPGNEHCFSPSGDALAYSTVEVGGEDAPGMRQPVTVLSPDGSSTFHATAGYVMDLLWLDDDHLFVRSSDLTPAGSGIYEVVCVKTGVSRQLGIQGFTGRFRSRPGSGHLTAFRKPEMPIRANESLFSLDTGTGEMQRLDAFCPSWESLEIYPLLGYCWAPDGRSCTVVGWPHDYLPQGVEGTRENSQWRPILDEPSIQKSLLDRPDGTRITQREMARLARTMRPRRLFRLRDNGDWDELPHTEHAAYPQLSPDGTVILFRKLEAGGEVLNALNLLTFERTRIGLVGFGRDLVIHPEGILFTDLTDEEAQPDGRHGLRPSRLHRFRICGGQVLPFQAQ